MNKPAPENDRFLTPIDKHLGNRVRLARLQRRMPQDVLADTLGLSRTTLVQYERNAYRLSGGRIYEIGVALNVDPGWFYKEYPVGPVPTETIDVLDASKWTRATMQVLETFHRLPKEKQDALALVCASMAP